MRAILAWVGCEGQGGYISGQEGRVQAFEALGGDFLSRYKMGLAGDGLRVRFQAGCPTQLTLTSTLVPFSTFDTFFPYITDVSAVFFDRRKSLVFCFLPFNSCRFR